MDEVAARAEYLRKTSSLGMAGSLIGSGARSAIHEDSDAGRGLVGAGLGVLGATLAGNLLFPLPAVARRHKALLNAAWTARNRKVRQAAGKAADLLAAEARRKARPANAKRNLLALAGAGVGAAGGVGLGSVME